MAHASPITATARARDCRFDSGSVVTKRKYAQSDEQTEKLEYQLPIGYKVRNRDRDTEDQGKNGLNAGNAAEREEVPLPSVEP